ncbi:hypothetical protein BGZ76_007974 [Entomortierella beljakovae]|nr:hypothetical protein BGZ76_007974 [Entomortierella beljakovae]
MNSLVTYASDSESESEEPIPILAKNKITSDSPSTTNSDSNTILEISAYQPQPSNSDIRLDSDHQNKDEESPIREEPIATDQDEEFMLAALNDLHDFAATVNPDDEQPISLDYQDNHASSTSTLDNANQLELSNDQKTPKSDSPEPIAPDTSLDLTPEQQAKFDAFLLEISSIPLTTKDQTRPPISKTESIAKDESLSLEADLVWKRTQPVHSIYSRMHQLSILQSPGINQKDIEFQLIEFAIRILDWEKGGMKPGYFLGEERAAAQSKSELAKNKMANDDDMEVDTDEEMDEYNDGGDSTTTTSMPPYGGIVGDIIERMSEIEQAAAPSGWKVMWDQEECVYKFKHISTPLQLPLKKW